MTARVCSCGICGLSIYEGDEHSKYSSGSFDYGLCHDRCIDMAENGPADSQLTDYAESPESRHEREYAEKRRLG